MDARSEITIKISGSLPPAKPAPNKKVEVELVDQNGLLFRVLLNGKSWRKAEANASEFAEWVASVSGKLAHNPETGFEIIDAGIQIFEKKKKDTTPVESDAVTESQASASA
ncbi:hypothetical protein F7734_00830 [Scytonema sp. UIC 10036]|uniref:hypothetical protein n=1 Tax=Scytonema sp. UIC 10036 TaxID=2304196 RepID=UPI0012DAD8B4|nr:hypothetical protein [Scytonema sp. UIC 10036]MUG91120.1 hypothetical protein [Scytonema sp. UIC 10036]